MGIPYRAHQCRTVPVQAAWPDAQQSVTPPSDTVRILQSLQLAESTAIQAWIVRNSIVNVPTKTAYSDCFRLCGHTWWETCARSS